MHPLKVYMKLYEYGKRIGVGIKWVPRGVRFYSAKMLVPTPLQ